MNIKCKAKRKIYSITTNNMITTFTITLKIKGSEKKEGKERKGKERKGCMTAT